MKLTIISKNKEQIFEDTTPQYNFPNIKDFEQLYYTKYMSHQLHKIQKSTYSTVFLDNHQSYILYLLNFNLKPWYQTKIDKIIYKKHIDVDENNFKCSADLNYQDYNISSNFQLNDNPSSAYFTIGNFIFPKIIQDNSFTQINQKCENLIQQIQTISAQIFTQS